MNNTPGRPGSPLVRWIVSAGFVAVMALTASGCASYGFGLMGAGGLSGGTGQTYARMYAGPIPVTLVNDAGRPACYVHISLAGSPSQGDDWLGPTEIVQPGNSRTFMVAANGLWDLRIDTCRNGEIAERHGVPFTGPTVLSMASLMTIGQPGMVVGMAGGELTPQAVQVTQPVVAFPPPPPLVQNNVTTHVEVHGPPPGGGVALGGDDVITLRDGSLLRGRVAEMHPGSTITLVLIDGVTREVPWADMASAAGPSFPQWTH